MRTLRKRPGGAGAVTISVRGGTYALADPLVFTPDDSGTADGPLTITNYANEVPVLSGGEPVRELT